jgi:hypothetical protein
VEKFDEFNQLTIGFLGGAPVTMQARNEPEEERRA